MADRLARTALISANNCPSDMGCPLLGGLLGLRGELWPVLVPVQRAHLGACDLAAGEFLDGFAVLGGDRFPTTGHL